MNLVKVLFFDTKSYDKQFFNEINKRYHFEIKYLPHRLSEDTASLASGYDAVCIFVNDLVSSKVARIFQNEKIKLIALRCAGYNNVHFKSLYGHIHVVRVTSYSPHAIAEHTLALMLSLNRKTHRAYYRTRDANFSIQGLLGFDMYGKTAGIIGTGKIGKLVAELLRAMGLHVMAFDLYPDKKWATAHDILYTDLDELYRHADIISLHCPLTPENVHMINRNSLELMKDGVMMINTGRGALIDSKALIYGLKSKKIGSAGLDVYEEEEKYFFMDLSEQGIDDDVLARLVSFPNVLVTSHQAFFTREAMTNIAETTMANISAFFEGKALLNEICYQCNEPDCRKKSKGRCF